MYFVITQNTRSERREESRSPRGVSAGCPTQSFFPPPPAHNMPKPPDREARARKRRKITADVAAAAAARAAAAEQCVDAEANEHLRGPAQVCRPAGHGGPRGAGLSTSRYRYSIPTAGRRPATSLYFLKSRFQVYRLSEKAREFGPTKQTQYGHVLPFCHPKHLLQLRNLIKREAPVCLPCRLGRLHYPGISGLYPR